MPHIRNQYCIPWSNRHASEFLPNRQCVRISQPVPGCCGCCILLFSEPCLRFDSITTTTNNNNMRRLKRDKLKPSSYAEVAAAAADTLLHPSDAAGLAAAVDSAKAVVAVGSALTTTGASKIMAKSRSPPQQRRRSVLLGLGGSVRELVEQVRMCCPTACYFLPPTSIIVRYNFYRLLL